MTYFGVLLTFIVPPLIVLAVGVPLDLWRHIFRRAPRPNTLPYLAVLLHVLIAVIYTTPWDNYLVASGVWWYDPALVTGITLGWVPIEEYTFFVLQTLLTGLWTVWLMRRIRPAALRPNPRLRLAVSAVLAALWAASAVLWFSGWQPGVYLSLILVWVLPPMMLQTAFGADILAARGRALRLAVGVPTLYLWWIDSLAITSGTWTIDPAQTTGLKPGGLPVEEMLFFLVTNVIVAGGVTLLAAPESLPRLKEYLAALKKRGAHA